MDLPNSAVKRYFRVDTVSPDGIRKVGRWVWGTYWDAHRRSFALWHVPGRTEIRVWNYARGASEPVGWVGPPSGTGDVGAPPATAADVVSLIRRVARGSP